MEKIKSKDLGQNPDNLKHFLMKDLNYNCEKAMKLTDEPIVANIIKLSYLTVKLLSELLGLRPASLFKKRLWHRRFPVNLVKFLRTLFS